jgi:hypothetical protein
MKEIKILILNQSISRIIIRINFLLIIKSKILFGKYLNLNCESARQEFTEKSNTKILRSFNSNQRLKRIKI